MAAGNRGVLAVLLFVKWIVVRGTFQPCERQFCAIYTSPSHRSLSRNPLLDYPHGGFQRWTCVRFANRVRLVRHTWLCTRDGGARGADKKQKLQVREIARSTTSFPRPICGTTHNTLGRTRLCDAQNNVHIRDRPPAKRYVDKNAANLES